MNRLALGALIAMGLSAAAQAQDAQADFLLGNLNGFGSTVYVASNNATANSVAVLKRDLFGKLSKVQVVNTGGTGVGAGINGNPPVDPLGSQNSLLLSQDGRYLYAVNAGSNQISVFAVEGDRLFLLDLVPSGGTYPVSLAQRGNTLYVLNSAGQANIVPFNIGRFGELTQLGGARSVGTNVPLSGNQPGVGNTAAQLQVSHDGKWLAVTVKSSTTNGTIELFGFDRQGNLAQQPTTTPSVGNGAFGFTFDDQNHLLVSEAAAHAVSSYEVQHDGSLKVISASVPNGQAATCWLDANAHYAYAANAGSSTLSGYRVFDNGQLQLLQANGVSANLGTGHSATDVKISRDGHSLYVLSPSSGEVRNYFVAGNGALVFVGDIQLFPATSGMQGLAVN